MEGPTSVRCFCLSVKVLELTRLVGEIWGEMTKLRESVQVLRKENDDLVERVIVGEGEWRSVEWGGSSVEVRKKPTCVCHPHRWRKSESGEGAKEEVLQGGEYI